MVSKKTGFLLTLLCLLFILENTNSQFEIQADDSDKIDCKSKCEYRCSKASRHKICIRACNSCCQRCNCVPPGTAGNGNVCPCYATMTTHGGRPKCP